MKDFETICRGKRIESGEWVYGELITDSSLADSEKYEVVIRTKDGMDHVVDGVTVGWHSGCVDTKGKDIFQNDRMRHAGRKGVDSRTFIVIYDEYACCFLREIVGGFGTGSVPLIPSEAKQMEVFGNIFDNPAAE